MLVPAGMSSPVMVKLVFLDFAAAVNVLCCQRDRGRTTT